MQTSTQRIIKELNLKIESEEFKDLHKSNVKDFSRTRSLNFVLVMVSIINKLSKSLSVEVTKYLQRFGKTIVSKQAFSKARYKISASAFIDLNETFIRAYYSHGNYELFHQKYLLLAADGSDYQLPWETDIVEHFGFHDNGQGRQRCLGKSVNIWDVNNQMNVSSALGTSEKGEKFYFQKAWKNALDLFEQADLQVRKLLLLDSYYPSFSLFTSLLEQNTDYIASASATFCREVEAFMKTEKEEMLLTIPIAGDGARKHNFKKQKPNLTIPDKIVVRAVRLSKDNEPDICLLTSLKTLEFDYHEIRQFFSMRWGQETSFRFDKSRSEVENFASKKSEGIYQEFYANLFANNLSQLLINDAQQILDEEQKNKNNKYVYKINRSVALGLMKDELPVLIHGQQDIDTFCHRMIKLFLKNKIPIIPKRSFPRKKKHKLKFSMNFRRIF